MRVSLVFVLFPAPGRKSAPIRLPPAGLAGGFGAGDAAGRSGRRRGGCVAARVGAARGGTVVATGFGAGITSGWTCSIGAACGSSDNVGAIAARLSATGSGAVEDKLTSLAKLTVIRSGMGGTSSLPGCITSTATSARCRATATPRPTRSSVRSAASAIIRSDYGAETEPLVTNDIALKPARFNSPITAITLPYCRL